MPKINRRLTEAEIRNAKPKDKAYKLYDEGGLLLLIRPTGTKVWQYPYKFNGKYNVYTIGQYDPNERSGYFGSAAARKVRDEVKALLKQGIDPNQSKQVIRQSNIASSDSNFESIAREWHSKQIWAPKHALNILRTLENDVFPFIGKKHINSVTAQDIISILRRIEERDAVDVAKRINQRCTAIFDYAIVLDVCENNPAAGRSKFLKSKPTKHRPGPTEGQLPELLNKLEEYQGSKLVILAMKFLLLTFVRPGELRFAEWKEIDEAKKEWRIPAERMKMGRPHIVPLSNQALEIINEIRKISGKNNLLFPGVKGDQRPISDVTLTKVLRTLGYIKENNKLIVPHGFRSTASTILNENGFNRDAIERQLSHVEENKIRAAYNHSEYLDERKRIMQWWADYLDKLKAIYHE